MLSLKLNLFGALFILFFIRICVSASGQIYLERSLTEGQWDTAIILRSVRESRQAIKSDPEHARELATEAYRSSQKIAFNQGARMALEILIDLNIQERKFELALRQISLMMQHCEPLRGSDCMMNAYHFKGLILQSQGKYQESLESYFKAINAAPDNQRISGVYNNIGGVMQQLGETEKSISFYQKALSLAKMNYQQPLIGFYHINIARGQLSALDFEKSKQNLDSGISYARTKHQKEALIYGLVVKASLYTKMEQYKEALVCIKEARLLTDIVKSEVQFQYLVYILEGLAHAHLNQFNEAEQSFQKASRYIAKMSSGDYTFYVSVKAEYHYRKGSYKQAYELAREARLLADSLKTKEVKINVNELETRFRTAEKDKEIALKNLQVSEGLKKVTQQNMVLLSVLFSFTLLTMLGFWRYLHLRRQQKHKNEIERLQGRIEGEEKERARLAQDLHDDINSQLTAVQTFLQAEANLNPWLKQAANFSAAQGLLQNTASGVRQIAHNLAPEQLLQKGLTTVIEEFCQGIFADNILKAHIDIYGDFSRVPTQLSLTIYRIIQELAQNIRKHASATEATVILYKEETQITLIVEDNGKGMAEVQLKRKEGKGMGLYGIQKRVNLYQGTFAMERTVGEGLSVHITFPLDQVRVD